MQNEKDKEQRQKTKDNNMRNVMQHCEMQNQIQFGKCSNRDHWEK